MDALRTALLVVAILATGCRRGYVIDVPRNRVTYQTWDEGNGTRRFPVIGADAATFEAFEIPGVGGETSGDDHRGPPRMAYRRFPLPVDGP